MLSEMCLKQARASTAALLPHVDPIYLQADMRYPHERPARDDARDKLIAAGQLHRSEGVRLTQVDLATGERTTVGNACNVSKYTLYWV